LQDHAMNDVAEPECQCEGPGLCPRYGIVQGEHHVRLCRTDPLYRRKWRLRKEGKAPLAVVVESAAGPTAACPWPGKAAAAPS
jgi:hypothetical protein